MIRTCHSKCAVCGSDNHSEQFTALDCLHGGQDVYHYVECRSCSHLYINPCVDIVDIDKIYPTDYSPHIAAPSIGSYEPKVRSWTNKLLDAVRYHLVFRVIYWLKGMRLSQQVYSTLNKDSHILDIGCGSGSYLNMLKLETGATVHGVDISANAVETAQKEYGIEVFQGNIEEYPRPPQSYDLITSWWYLEHVPNPRLAVQKMAELLKPNGICTIGVPNARSLNRYLFKGLWYHLDTPRHYNLWTRASLKKMAGDYGLVAFDERSDKTPWGLLGSLQYVLLGNNYEPWKRNLIRGNAVLTFVLLPFTWIMALLGYSDVMVIYFRKSSTDK